jgi:hypothetical protein
MFDEEKHKQKCQPYVDKLKVELDKKGISFSTDKWNVIFTKGDNEYRIADRCFYRFSGLCMRYKVQSVNKKGVHTIEEIPVKLEEYITGYMKNLILKHFEE